MNNEVILQRKKLTYRAKHRGIREMDIILGGFADKYLPGFDQGQLNDFENILSQNDLDLYDWLNDRQNIDMDNNILAILYDFYQAS